LKSHGFEGYLVGGCVRDLVLYRDPKDFDVTTNATPEQVQRIFEKTIPVGASFGVIIVVVDDVHIEVATYRTDGQYSDNRRPDDVAYSTNVKDDLVRRDFTINGLIMIPKDQYAKKLTYDEVLAFGAPVEHWEHGVVIDYVGGMNDIRGSKITCIGDPDARFGEDALRMLRAVRFAAQLGFTIDTATGDSITKNAASIVNVSRERIAAELFKLVSSSYPVKGLVPFATTGLLRYALPEFDEGARFAYTLERFAKFQTSDPLFGLTMLLADADFVTATTTLDGLKLSNEQGRLVRNALQVRAELPNVGRLSLSQKKRLARGVGLQYGLDLFAQDEAIGRISIGTTAVRATTDTLLSFTPEDVRPKPLVTGDDLISMGLTPGPEFRHILDMIEEGQLSETITFRSVAVEVVKKIAEARGLTINA
jgi:hypothetical protein